MIGDLADFTINLQYIENIKIHIRNLHPVKIVEIFYHNLVENQVQNYEIRIIHTA